MNFSIQEMTIADYEAALALWQAVEGVGVSEADSLPRISQFLARNPGLSFAAYRKQTLVGTVLGGHDGRRGYIHHLAVSPACRGQGIGRVLAERCLAALAQEGIDKCHIFVFKHNQVALEFWRRTGWTERVELAMMSHYTRP